MRKKSQWYPKSRVLEYIQDLRSCQNLFTVTVSREDGLPCTSVTVGNTFSMFSIFIL